MYSTLLISLPCRNFEYFMLRASFKRWIRENTASDSFQVQAYYKLIHRSATEYVLSLTFLHTRIKTFHWVITNCL